MFDGNWERKSVKNTIRKDWSDEEVDDWEKMVSRNLREERSSSRKRVGADTAFCTQNLSEISFQS